MLEKIEKLLKTLNIDLGYQIYNGNADEYIIFDIVSERDTTFADDVNLEEKKYITINYWHKSKSGIKKYKEIKKLFKKNGFFFDSMKTLSRSSGVYDSADEFYGKNFVFTMEELSNE
ncbi:hypothetical protein N2W42_001147 [Clostridium perfringens]|nr:hypothetical protein [Clostridium perfringens]